MDLASSKNDIKLFKLPEDGAGFTDQVARRETRNNRFVIYNANDDNVVLPETSYRVDLTVVNANVRSAVTCQKYIKTEPIPPLTGLVFDEAKSRATWDPNSGADNYVVDIYELANEQNTFVSSLTDAEIGKLNLDPFKQGFKTTLVEPNGGATSVDIGPGLVAGSSYLVSIKPNAGGIPGESDLIKVTMSK